MNLKKNSKMELRIALNRIPSEVIALCPKSRLKWFQMKKLQVRCYCLTSEEISRLSGKSPNVPDSNSSNVKIEMNDSHEVVDQLPLVQLQSVSESLTNDINDNDVEFLSASQNSEDTSKESCSSKQVFIGSSPELDVFAEKWESESEHEDSSEHQLDQPYGNQNDSPFHDISFESKLECNSESEHGDSSKIESVKGEISPQNTSSGSEHSNSSKTLPNINSVSNERNEDEYVPAAKHAHIASLDENKRSFWEKFSHGNRGDSYSIIQIKMYTFFPLFE